MGMQGKGVLVEAVGEGKRAAPNHHTAGQGGSTRLTLSCPQDWLAHIPVYKVNSTVLPRQGTGPVLSAEGGEGLSLELQVRPFWVLLLDHTKAAQHRKASAMCSHSDAESGSNSFYICVAK